jgi:Glucodextranase, domain B/Bacterial Ig-like domain (group 1)
MPLLFRLALALVVVALGVGVLYVGAGGLSRVAGAVGTSFGGFVDELIATPLPTSTDIPISDAPILEPPEEPFTATANVDLLVTIPAALVGDDVHRIRILQQLKDQAPVAIGEFPIGETQRMVVPVELEKGINDFSAIIVGPSGGSEASPTVRYVYDKSKPNIKITSPKDNAKVNRKAVEIKGTTQGRATLIARNESNDTSVSGQAAADGTFTLSLPLRAGTNRITITATDPAGNVREEEFRVRRGSGKLTVALGATDYQFSRRRLPDPIRLTAIVKDPDGNRLEGAQVTFTLSVPGIAVITREATTDDSGRASFETTIPKSADVGQGLAAVLVETDKFGSVDDRAVISIER